MKYLSFDTRALALMRICIASVIMLDLGVRLTDLEVFYSDTGAVPLKMVFEHAWNLYFFSVHTISGLWQVQLFLFLFSFFCAFMLLVGYRTKLFTFLSWLMMMSLHNRNVFILQGGDDLLRMILFWGMFIPWGEQYSCDRLLSPVKEERKTIRSLGTFAYLLQICYLYTGSALLKGTEWNQDFTAVYYAYSLDQIAYPVTRYLYYYPELLKVLTFMAYYFELLVPLLFFIPYRHQLFRTTGVVLILLFHTWNGMTLLIGMFFLIGMASALGILPTVAMDRFDRLLLGLRKYVKQAFFTVSYLVRKFLPWRPGQYAESGFREKVTTAVLVFLILFIADWNLSNLRFINSKLPPYLHPVAYALRIDQHWGMFAPGVLKDDGWYVMKANCADGSCINPLTNDTVVSYKKPENVVAMFRNDRWRKYTENYMFASNSFMRGYFCNYYRRVWNETHEDKKISTLQIIYMMEFTKPDYQYAIPEQAILCNCGE